MDTDEEFARKLQQQFDEEAAAAAAAEQRDTELAHRLAKESHNMSESEDEDTVESIQEHEQISKSYENNSKVSVGECSTTKRVEKSPACSTSISKRESLQTSNNSAKYSNLHTPSTSKPKIRTESSTKKLEGKMKIDSPKSSKPLSPEIKTSAVIDIKKKPSSSSKTVIAHNSIEHSLHKSIKDLATDGMRKKDSRYATSPNDDTDQNKTPDKKKSVDVKSSVGKLEKSPTLSGTKQKSPHQLKSVASLVKSSSDPGSSQTKLSPPDNRGERSSYDTRPLCKYGADCYRTNPIHLNEFRHGEHLESGLKKKKQEADGRMKKAKSNTELGTTLEKNANQKLNSSLHLNKSPKKKPTANTSNSSTLKRQPSQDGSNEPPLKKKKSDESNSTSTGDKPKGFAARLAASDPYRLFLTKSFSVPASHNDPLGIVLPDLLQRSLGTVVETAQFSFVVDLDFVYDSYKACDLHEKPLLLLYGEMEGDTTQFPKGNFVKVSMPFLYGTHHTKLMLLLYTEGLRVVVHTANLRPDDWFEKTQGVWVSPLFPKMAIRAAAPGSPPPGEAPTLFRQDLLQYLQSYKLAPLGHWCDLVRRHDFSQCNAVFVGHVPGYHAGPALPLYGQLKLKRALGRHTNKDKWRSAEALRKSTTFVQCSSIGSLGKDATWLSQDLGASLSGGQSCPASKVVVMYPSEEDVRFSSQGWMGGSCLPYQSSTHAKQPWLVKHLHHWRSDKRHRTPAMPHIKTYMRIMSSSSSVTTTDCEAQYLLLTSANLSKAAWGQVQKQGVQLFIRSYEAGVLLLPKFVTGGDCFPLSGPRALPLPYDLPPAPYTPTDKPWFMDTNKKTKDITGDTYPA